MLSPLVREMADARGSPAPEATAPPASARAGAVFEVQYAVLAVFCTAPFLAHLLRSRTSLLEHADFSERKRNACAIFNLVCEWGHAPSQVPCGEIWGLPYAPLYRSQPTGTAVT